MVNDMKKVIFIVFMSALFLMTGCTDYSEHGSADRYNDIIKIATYTKNQYDSYKLQANAIITSDTLKNYENDSEIAELFATDNCFYKSTMIDTNTVLIQKNVVFQSVTGYIATKSETLDTTKNENDKNPVLDIPSFLGYDGNLVTIEDDLGEYDEWHLYYYIAGL